MAMGPRPSARQLLSARPIAMQKTSLKRHCRHPRLLNVKKNQRGFDIEYKSSRRKPGSKPNSIWGNINLKSVARDVQEEVPFLWASPRDRRPDGSVSLPDEEQARLSMTLPIVQQSTASDLHEAGMADKNDTMIVVAPAASVPDKLKIQRKPRAMKTSVEVASGEIPAPPAAGEQKRGRNPRLDQGASGAMRTAIKRVPKAVRTASGVVDEMANLLQLEEENLRLRKLLTEKLRAENADLRKRLNLS
jgi:hypothetical protein